MLDVLSDVKRLASAAETLFAARVAETDAWSEGSADRSPRTGWPVGPVYRSPRRRPSSRRPTQLSDLPATAEAYRAGRLSDQQAREVVAGAVADPQAEQGCWARRRRSRCSELRNESRRAQAVDDDEGRQRRSTSGAGCGWVSIPTGRSGCRSPAQRWRCGRSSPRCGRSPIRPSNRPSKEGRLESHAAYDADGFVAMAAAAAAAGRRCRPKPKSPT